MKPITLNLRGKAVKEFPSLSVFSVYVIDILARIAVLVLLALAGCAQEIITSSNAKLSAYVWLYSFAIVVWGLLLLKFVVARTKVFGKTKFDLFFMGLLTILLISTLLSEDRVRTVFGSLTTWSYSVITILSISILYYVSVLIFRYARGIKWLSLGFVLSILIPGVYYVFLILTDQKTGNMDYMMYAAFSIPLAIGIIFLFRKIVLKGVAFIGIFFSLILVTYYSDMLQGSMFVLGMGVLALFLLFYFSFWIKNSRIVLDFVKDLLKNIRDFRSVRKKIKQKNKEGVILLMMIFMALWIVGLTIFNLRYFRTNIGPYLGDRIRDNVESMEGARVWLIGKPDLSSSSSTMEIFNILSSYGIFSALLYLIFLGYSVFMTGKLTLKLLYTGSFRNVILLSSMFVTMVSILINFLLSRFSPMIYILLMLVFVIYAIIDDLFNQKESYTLEVSKGKVSMRVRITQIVVGILILGVTISGVLGVLLGIDRGIFIST